MRDRSIPVVYRRMLRSGTFCRRMGASLLCIAATLVPAGRAMAQDADPMQQRIDAAIVKALKALARDQSPSGAWLNREDVESTAMTGLAVMAFMAAGHVPGEGPYGDRLEKAVSWVIQQQRPNGMLVGRTSQGPMYSHGICTLMLAEVMGMLDDPLESRCRKALEQAIKLTLDAQNVSKPAKYDGGWRYQITSTDSDLSVTGWQLLSLRAAKNVGCDVPAANIDRAVRYVKSCSVRGNDGFGYQVGTGASPTRTGTGILALEVCGEHRCAESMGGADYLVRTPLREDQPFFYYGAYYCTVGLFKIGGPHWEHSRDPMFQTLLRLQNFDGHWPLARMGESRAGRVYSTSMSVLALAVEYRFLPIYQR